FDRHTFGDMAPYAFRTTDFGKTWNPLVTAQDAKGIRGYAHVIKEDVVKPSMLFLGTEFGLYVSINGGKEWAQFKGGRFPAVAVRDLAIQPRESDLVLATHGRGIWIVDDITPWRALTPELLPQEAAFVSARPVQQQRIEGGGGWANGDAVFIGDNPPDAAVITYYQKARHLFGKLKSEVLDSSGQVVDELPASKRPGLNRVTWSMRAKTDCGLPEADPLQKRVSDFDGKVDAVRKQIVATKEGRAITGEERLREHTDQLYGALLSYEGKPGDYQLAYFEALKLELADVSKEFAGLVAKDLPALNDAL